MNPLPPFLPRRVVVGPLILDVFHRDAMVENQWLHLHPREFELLWRLAETPGQPTSKEQLLRDVWRLRDDPGTNSVAVHISRLRSRLADHGVDNLIRTHADAGYAIAARELISD